MRLGLRAFEARLRAVELDRASRSRLRYSGASAERPRAQNASGRERSAAENSAAASAQRCALSEKKAIPAAYRIQP